MDTIGWVAEFPSRPDLMLTESSFFRYFNIVGKSRRQEGNVKQKEEQTFSDSQELSEWRQELKRA